MRSLLKSMLSLAFLLLMLSPSISGGGGAFLKGLKKWGGAGKDGGGVLTKTFNDAATPKTIYRPPETPTTNQKNFNFPLPKK